MITTYLDRQTGEELKEQSRPRVAYDKLVLGLHINSLCVYAVFSLLLTHESELVGWYIDIFQHSKQHTIHSLVCHEEYASMCIFS